MASGTCTLGGTTGDESRAGEAAGPDGHSGPLIQTVVAVPRDA